MGGGTITERKLISFSEWIIEQTFIIWGMLLTSVFFSAFLGKIMAKYPFYQY